MHQRNNVSVSYKLFYTHTAHSNHALLLCFFFALSTFLLCSLSKVFTFFLSFFFFCWFLFVYPNFFHFSRPQTCYSVSHLIFQLVERKICREKCVVEKNIGSFLLLRSYSSPSINDKLTYLLK